MESKFRNRPVFDPTEFSRSNGTLAELASIDWMSARARSAIRELDATYFYVGVSVNHAAEAVNRVQEMYSLVDCDPNEYMCNQYSYPMYTRKLEYILNELTSQLANVVRQNATEEFIYRGVLLIKAILKRMLKEKG